MFKQFMDDLIDSKSIKVVLSLEAKDDFAKEDKVMFVHSPVLYRLYTLYVGDEGKKETRPTFYRKVGMYLYYEYFHCSHGTEYYYYIKFNEESAFYKEHEQLIKRLVLANDPVRLKNYTGFKPLNIYNSYLKEELKWVECHKKKWLNKLPEI